MPTVHSNLTSIAALALLATVLTQVLYLALGASGTPLALVLWRVEAVAFLLVALTGAALIAERPLAGAALAVGGMLNVLQAGMGLVMFGPLRSAGEALGPVMEAVLGFAFFLYFAGKVAFALAGLAIGTAHWAKAMGAARIVGGLAVLTGLVAFATNGLAMVTGMKFTLFAGGAGTVATLFLALALLLARARA